MNYPTSFHPYFFRTGKRLVLIFFEIFRSLLLYRSFIDSGYKLASVHNVLEDIDGCWTSQILRLSFVKNIYSLLFLVFIMLA